MNARKLIAGLVAGTMAMGAWSETFLEKLANDERVVDFSLYATGGDIILQLGEDEYVHVFTNAAAAETFTALQMLNARLLLIGGGGAGGGTAYYGSGGGGAGGMLEVDSFIMAADSSYSLAVGAGCKTIQNNGGLLNNGADTVMASGEIELYRAFGGGGGGGANAAAKGGSGGGGATRMNSKLGGAGEPGQGCDGGSTSGDSIFGGSGGGGAGGEGGAFDGSNGSGSGGAGKMSDILGFEQYFAGGGAGYKGVGGTGGGGNGAGGSAKAAGNNGEDGLGGGGAGASGSGNGQGAGGDGLVAIRYLYRAASTTNPEVEASVAAADIYVASFDITVALSSTGSRTTADLTAVYGYAPDELTHSRSLATEVAAGAYQLSFAAEPGRTYYLKIVADNHADELNTAETEVFSVTAGNPFGDVSLATARGEWSMASSLSSLGSGENVVCLAIATSEKGEYVPVENSAALVTAAGDFGVDANMLQAGYTFDGKTYYAKLMHVYAPVDGGAEVTNWSAFATGVLKDSGSFTLVQAGGSWIDAETWSGPATSEYGAVYPGYGATATIAAGLSGTVEVPGVFYVSFGFFNSGAGHAITFKGVGDDAFINLTAESTFDYFTGTNVFDNVGIDVRTLNGFSNNRLGRYFGVVNGATVKCYPTFSHLDTVVDIANGGYLYFDQAVAAETTGSFSFKGAAPTVEFKQNFTAATGGTPFLFAIPAEGYETAPVMANTKFPAGGKVIVNLPAKRDLPLRTGSLGECDIPLIRSTVGLDQSKIEFGNNPLPEPCGFRYSEDGKTLYYHYKPRQGLIVFIGVK